MKLKLIFFISILALQLSAQTTLLKALSLEHQIQNSKLVIEGKVINKQAFEDKNLNTIYTINTVEVYKIFKGTLTAKTIKVITEGGKVGNQAVVVCPSLELEIGALGTFILNPAKRIKDAFETYGSVQSFYQYNLKTNEVVNPFSKKKGITTAFYKSINEATQSPYKNVKTIDVSRKLTAENTSNAIAANAITFNPSTITAGTFSVLTINGTGFGPTKGDVSFSNPDDGGKTFKAVSSNLISSWTDSQIKVIVPTRAGSGPVKITDALGSSAESTNKIIVPYALTNIDSDNKEYQTQHINANAKGGYTWQMNSSFAANTKASAALLRALISWRCNSGINWIIGDNTSINTIARDEVNIIRFDVGDELPAGVLGRCTSYYIGCVIGTSEHYYVNELDMVFDDEISWNFGPEASTFFQYDFESVALHELGHGHQLSHVIDSKDVMNFNISNGEDLRILGTANINSAKVIQKRSTTNTVCGQTLMKNFDCNSVDVSDDKDQEIKIYPNPTQGDLFVKSPEHAVKRAEVYDILGKLIYEIDLSKSQDFISKLDLREYAKGVYIIKLHTEATTTIKKIIVK